MTTPLAPESIRPPGRAEARATGLLMMAGAGLVAMSLLLPHPSGGHTIALAATAAGLALAGLLVWVFASQVPLLLTHLLLAGVNEIGRAHV